MSVYEVGGATAVVTLDQRHHRAPHQILPLEHYMDIALLGPSLPEVWAGRGAAACPRERDTVPGSMQIIPFLPFTIASYATRALIL